MKAFQRWVVTPEGCISAWHVAQTPIPHRFSDQSSGRPDVSRAVPELGLSVCETQYSDQAHEAPRPI